jgi:uroporphyrinogen-III synthase
MLVLVTRPRAQALETAHLLEAMGHHAIIDPVIEIRPLPLPDLDLNGVALLAVTSANAAPALAGLDRELPVYAVGEATAAAVRAVGMQDVHIAEGDGRTLARLIARERRPEEGAILHLSGQEVHPSTAEALVAHGFAYRRVVAYAAVPTEGLSPETLAALRDGWLNAVLLYSPRSALLWAERVTDAGLKAALARVVAVCLSEAVAAALDGLPFKERRIAAARDQKALLRCLEAAS